MQVEIPYAMARKPNLQDRFELLSSALGFGIQTDLSLEWFLYRMEQDEWRGI